MCVEMNDVAAPQGSRDMSELQIQQALVSTCLMTSVHPLFMEMEEKGGNKMALRSHLIRGELEMITAECPFLHRGV